MVEKETWGIATSCGSESNLYGIICAKKSFPDKIPIIICSDNVHWSIKNYASINNININFCSVDEYGQIKISSFEEVLLKNIEYIKENGVIIVLTMGTTVKCGYDNLSDIYKKISKYKIDYYIHLDACLGGFILPFLKNNPINHKINKFNSISVSAHNILGTPYPVSFFICDKKNKLNLDDNTRNSGSLFSSRNGQAILYLYSYLCNKNSFDEITKYVNKCLYMKKYLIKKLNKYNIEYNTNPNNGLSVYLPRKNVNDPIIEKYHLYADDTLVRIFSMRSIKKEVIDELVHDLKKRL